MSADVDALLKTLPAGRRKELEKVRKAIRKHLPPGYEETVTNGMIVYQVPFEKYSDTYNGHPLWYAALAAPKSYLTLHLMAVHGSEVLRKKLESGFRAAGKKLDMGKACIRFQSADDLALDAIGESVAAVPMDRYVESAKAARRGRAKS